MYSRLILLISGIVSKSKIRVGIKIYLGNINTSRDFNYVEDICEGFVSALKSKLHRGETFNLATGKDIKIKEVIKKLEKITKHKPEIIIQKKRIRSSEVFNLIGSNRMIIKDLKWKPKYMKQKHYNNALLKTIDWFGQTNNYEKYKHSIDNYNT